MATNNNEFIIAFEAGVSSLDEASLKEASRAIKETLQKNSTIQPRLENGSVEAIVQSLKVVEDKVHDIKTVAAQIKIGNDKFTLNFKVDEETKEFQELSTTITSTVNQAEKELKGLYSRVTQLQNSLNRSLQSGAEGLSKYYSTALDEVNKEIAETEERMKSALMQTGVGEKEAQSLTQRTSANLGDKYLEAISAEKYYEQEGAIRQLNTALNELFKTQNELAVLEADTSSSEIRKEALKSLIAQQEQNVQSIIGENTALQELATTRSQENSLEQNVSVSKAKEVVQNREVATTLRELNSLLTERNRIQSQIAELEKRMQSPFYNTKENREYLSLLKDQNSALEKRITTQKEVASQLGKTAEAEEMNEEAVKKLNLEIARNNAMNSKQRGFLTNLVQGFKEVTYRVLNYTLAFQAANQVMRLFTDSISTIISLNKEFTDIQMVTGQTATEVAALAQEYSLMAQEMGATTSQVAQAASEYLRQGRSLAETNELIQASLTLSKVGAIESAQATQYLTSTLNGYQLAAEDAMHVVDALAAVDLKAATSTAELAEALQRSANSGREAGVGFERLIGYIGTISETTRRSASSIGESLKTMFARFQNIKAGRFISESGESLNDVESVLGKLGIQLRTTYGEWRRVEDVLDDVSDRWNTLNQTEQNAISTAIAGTRQRENFLALMSNYQRALELEETALTSNGIAAEKFDTYLQSIEASMNELKSAFESFAYSEGTVAVVNGVIKVLTLLMKTLKELAPAISFVLGMLISAKIFNGFVDGVNKVGVAFTQLAAETGGVKSAIAGLSAESGIFASALKALISPAGLLAIALTAVGAAAVYQHRKQREAEKTIHETAKAYKEQADEITKLKEKQKDIAEQIATMESLDKSIVDPNDLQRLKDENAELEKQIKQKERLANIDAAEGYKDSREQLGRRTIYPDAKGMTFEGNYALIDQTELYISQYKSINEQLQENIKIRDSLINVEGKVAQEELAQYNSVNDKISRLREKQDKYLKTVQNNISIIRDAMAVLEANGETTGELYDTYSSFLNVLNNFEAQVRATTGATDDSTRASQDNSDALKQQILDGKELADVLSDLASKQKLLATAQEDVTNTGAITASTLASIASQYPSMVDAVASYIAGLTSEKELLDSLQQAYIDNENAQLQLVVDKLQNDVDYYNKVKELNQDWLNDMDKLYDINLDGAQTLNEAKLQADQILIKALSKIWSDYFNSLQLANKSVVEKIVAIGTTPFSSFLGGAKEAMVNYGEVIVGLNKISLEPLRVQFDKLTAATNTSKSSASEYNKELKEAQSVANKLLQYTINMLKKEAELRKQKLKEELDAYKDIIDARKEALDLEKEQYDYEKSISKQNSQISQLESQIAALQYDTSAEGVKKRLELEEKLA